MNLAGNSQTTTKKLHESWLFRTGGMLLLLCSTGFSQLYAGVDDTQDVTLSACDTRNLFTIAAIPDTQAQSHTEVWADSVLDATQWLRGNAKRRNIALVTQLGDVVQGGSTLTPLFPGMTWSEQWRRMDRAFSPLDMANQLDGNVLPYSVSLGNHDVEPTNDKSNTQDTFERSAFVSHFGPQRYAGYSWYKGSDSTGLNHYQIFKAGPFTYLHLNLEIDPQNPTAPVQLDRTEPDAIAWAQTVLDHHPDLPTIISTHKYLTDLGPEGYDVVGYAKDGVDDSFGGERLNTGDILWERLVRGNPQIFMTLNGHEHEGKFREDGEYHQVSYNDFGQPVFEILINYQDYENPLTGSDPYIRLVEFDVARGEIRHSTYSPTFDAFARVNGFAEQRLDQLLDAFEHNFLPITINEGEDLIGVVLANNPYHRLLAKLLNAIFGDNVALLEDRQGAERVVLKYFRISNRSELSSAVSPYLTDADSQFKFKVSFSPGGRPQARIEAEEPENFRNSKTAIERTVISCPG